MAYRPQQASASRGVVGRPYTDQRLADLPRHVDLATTVDGLTDLRPHHLTAAETQTVGDQRWDAVPR